MIILAESPEEVVKLAKANGKAKAKKPVKAELLPNQEHMLKRGDITISHLIAVPAGEEPHWALKKLFDRSPFGQSRDAWNIISDQDLAEQMPDHDIYWLCPASAFTAEWVQAVVSAIYSEAPRPKREIKTRIVLG